MDNEHKIRSGELIQLGTTDHISTEIHPNLDAELFDGATVNTGALNGTYFLNFVASAETLVQRNNIEDVELIAYEFPGGVGWCWCWVPQRMGLVLRMICKAPGITNDTIYSTTKLDSRSRVSELRSGGIIITSRQMPGKDRVQYHVIGHCAFDIEAILSMNPRHIKDAFPSLDFLDLEREEQIRLKTVKLMRSAAHHLRRLRLHSWETTIRAEVK